MTEVNTTIRKRGWMLSALLIFQITYNSIAVLGLIIGFFIAAEKMRQVYPSMPSWGLYYLPLAGFLDIVAPIGVWKWEKWGVYLYLINCALYTTFALCYSFPFWEFVMTLIEVSLFIILVIPKWKLMK